MVMLLPASRIHNSDIAIRDRARQRHEEQAECAQHGTDQEIGCAPAPSAGGPVAHRADDRLDEEPRDRPGKLEHGELGFVGTQIAVYRPHVALLQPEAELQAQESEIHLEYPCQRQVRSICVDAVHLRTLPSGFAEP